MEDEERRYVREGFSSEEELGLAEKQMIQLPTLIPPYCGRSEATERKDYLFASP